MSVTRQEYTIAKAKGNYTNSLIEIQTKQINKTQDLIASNQAAGVNTAGLQATLAAQQQKLSEYNSSFATYSNTVNQFENQITIPSNSESLTEQKYEESIGYNEETAALPDDSQSGVYNEDELPQIKKTEDITEYGNRSIRNIPRGAERLRPEPTKFVFKDISGKKLGQDLRVKILVPSNYLTTITSGLGNELRSLNGIIFPYTPAISTEISADYSSMTPLHSNFPINFYQRSKVGDISVTGKFTVDNTYDASIFISTVHLLKALTRMRSGGKTGDSDSGSPPPICRFYAYGEMMFENVPVAIRSFRLELPDGVDYFTIRGTSEYGPTSVPVLSTIAVILTPMYSRNEMQNFSVSKYLSGNQSKKQGYI